MDFHDHAELARALFEESGDALFLLDPDTDRLIDVNPLALRMTGFARAEVLQYPATNLFRVEATGGMQRLRGAFAKTMAFHGQDGYLLRSKEESAWIPVSLTASRLHIAPKPLGLIVARDDRERRAALAQARRVEAELRTVLANAPAALWSAERSPGPNVLLGWQYRYVSPLLAVLAGQPPDFLDHPMRWAEAIHGNDRERYRASVRKLLTGTAAEVELVYRVPIPGGTTRWIRDRLQVVRDRSGRPTRLDGCVADFTAQRHAEDAVRQSERRFRALVEKSQEGILLLDEQGTIAYASPSTRSISGYDPAALVGRPGIDIVHPDDRATVAANLTEILRRPGESVPWTGRGLTADGSVQIVETTGCNRLTDPSVRAIVVNYRDVTERVRLEEALRQAAKMEAVGRLAGGIAHDFNNLLTVVLGNLELIRGGVEPADAEELHASAEAAAKQAADLTRQMLGFARRQPLLPAVVDLNALAKQELTLLRRSIDPRVAIAFNPADGLRSVVADPVQLQQVLMNLCLNARDAMPDGGTLTIETANAGTPLDAAQPEGPAPDGYVRLGVSDTGIGMSEEVRVKVFEPFFTTKDVGRGTGLGLAVVYGVARAHGGWVECHSELGRGSRFDVYLPYAEGIEMAVAPGETATARPPCRGRGETILIADDESAVREMAAAGLAHHGYRTRLAEDGSVAVDAVRTSAATIDVVLLDLMMPNMNGRQAFEAIRAIAPDLPVLFASGYMAGQELPEPLPANTAFLDKPYTPSQLIAAIRRLLDGEPVHVGEGI